MRNFSVKQLVKDSIDVPLSDFGGIVWSVLALFGLTLNNTAIFVSLSGLDMLKLKSEDPTVKATAFENFSMVGASIGGAIVLVLSSIVLAFILNYWIRVTVLGKENAFISDPKRFLVNGAISSLKVMGIIVVLGAISVILFILLSMLLTFVGLMGVSIDDAPGVGGQFDPLVIVIDLFIVILLSYIYAIVSPTLTKSALEEAYVEKKDTNARGYFKALMAINIGVLLLGISIPAILGGITALMIDPKIGFAMAGIVVWVIVTLSTYAVAASHGVRYRYSLID